MTSEKVKPQIGGLASLLQTAKQKKLDQERLEAQSTVKDTSSERTKTARGNLPAQGNSSALGTLPAQGSLAAPGTTPLKSKRATQSGATLPAEIAPRRDFMKSANSVVRDALRNGLFRGKSKQIYDYLYSKTRGAVVPRISAQLRRAEIMQGSHVGSTHTLRDNLRHLQSVGLVNWEEKAGEQDGNEYFVYLPEEANLPFDFDGNPVQLNSPGHPNSPDHPGQKLPRPPRAETALGAQGSSSIDSTSSGNPKTFIKTIEFDDDEAAAKIARHLKQTTSEVTGKEASAEELARWTEVFEVLAAELKIAAARTNVSSAPAFLAEHLRRRLWKKDKQQIEAEGKSSPADGDASVEKGKCPDCGGSGFYYPAGFDGGVAKCKHVKLTNPD